MYCTKIALGYHILKMEIQNVLLFGTFPAKLGAKNEICYLRSCTLASAISVPLLQHVNYFPVILNSSPLLL